MVVFAGGSFRKGVRVPTGVPGGGVWGLVQVGDGLINATFFAGISGFWVGLSLYDCDCDAHIAQHSLTQWA